MVRWKLIVTARKVHLRRRCVSPIGMRSSQNIHLIFCSSSEYMTCMQCTIFIFTVSCLLTGFCGDVGRGTSNTVMLGFGNMGAPFFRCFCGLGAGHVQLFVLAGSNRFAPVLPSLHWSLVATSVDGRRMVEDGFYLRWCFSIPSSLAAPLFLIWLRSHSHVRPRLAATRLFPAFKYGELSWPRTLWKLSVCLFLLSAI